MDRFLEYEPLAGNKWNSGHVHEGICVWLGALYVPEGAKTEENQIQKFKLVEV